MKRTTGFLALLICTIVFFGLYGCKTQDDPPAPSATATADRVIESIELRNRAGKTYVLGETVQEDNNSLIANYSDGSTETISMDDPAVTISGDTSTAGVGTATVSYQGFETTFTYTVYAPMEETVEVTGGLIRGYTTEDGAIEIYKGIPYAAPPTGENRWHAPKDVEPWEGVKSCFHFGPSCYQQAKSRNDYIIDGWAGVSEDCLTLNVWTSGKETADKPVLVFIHGGGYTTGGSSCAIYDGTAMAQRDVVFVSINYRLGAFGYLSTEELMAENDGAGNFGMLDQIKALEWVRDNIAAFGGDKDNVTIMGQSAGGRSVQGLLLSPMASGLYANAFIDSGLLTTEFPTLEYRNANVTTDGKTLAELRSMTTEEVSASVNVTAGLCCDGTNILSTSCWESYIANAGNNQDINLLLGTVTGDDEIFRTDDPDEATLFCMSYVQARLLGGATGRHYIYFDEYVQGGAEKRNHTDDVPFWLGNSTNYYGEGSWTEADTNRAEMMSSMLVNFCKTGNPNGNALPEWEANEGQYNYLHLSDEIGMDRVAAEAISHFETHYSKVAAELGR